MRRTPPAGNPKDPKIHGATSDSRIYASDAHSSLRLLGDIVDKAADFGLKGASDLGL